MANGHGGARIGAGQKKKALADKLAEGNPGKRKLTVMEFFDTADLEGEQMPPPRDSGGAAEKRQGACCGGGLRAYMGMAP